MTSKTRQLTWLIAFILSLGFLFPLTHEASAASREIGPLNRRAATPKDLQLVGEWTISSPQRQRKKVTPSFSFYSDLRGFISFGEDGGNHFGYFYDAGRDVYQLFRRIGHEEHAFGSARIVEGPRKQLYVEGLMPIMNNDSAKIRFKGDLYWWDAWDPDLPEGPLNWEMEIVPLHDPDAEIFLKITE